MKEINGRITFLVDREYTTIEVGDQDSSVTFLRIRLTPEQLSSALSRLACTKCESTEVYSLDKVGKKMEMREEKVRLPWAWTKIPKSEQYKTVTSFLDDLAKDAGWENYTYLDSRDSFICDYKEGKFYVNALFRRWV